MARPRSSVRSGIRGCGGSSATLFSSRSGTGGGSRSSAGAGGGGSGAVNACLQPGHRIVSVARRRGIAAGQPNALPEIVVAERRQNSDAGYRADVVRFPEHGLALAVLCNFAGANPGQYPRQVADIILEGKLGAATSYADIDK